MKLTLRPAISLLIAMALVTGLVYPLLMTGFAKLLFAHEAAGGLIERDGTLVGAELIGQAFEAPGYFWGRPSATAPNPYNASASNGSNLGPLNPALAAAVKTRITALREAGAPADEPVPADLVTSSGSGLDPHISPAAAIFQITRVAHARKVSEAQLRALIDHNTEQADLGFIGQERVNVLKLNLELDRLANTH